MKDAETIAVIHDFGEAALRQVSAHFRNPRATMLIRDPELPNGYLVVTNDDLGRAADVLLRISAGVDRPAKGSC